MSSNLYYRTSTGEAPVSRAALLSDVRFEATAKIRRPKTAKREPRVTGEAFDPAKVSRTLSPRASSPVPYPGEENFV